jgi:small subunit ribosomal protein S17
MEKKHKILTGYVVSDKMDKTAVVVVESRRQHPLYKKVVRHKTRFKAHDENNLCRVGDVVRIMQTRPLSKEKRWRVVEIISRREVVEVQPSKVVKTLPQPRCDDTTLY